MSKISDTVSAKLRAMGLFCAFLVIFIHIDIRADARGPWIVHDYFSLGLGKIAVPFFFAAAGYIAFGVLTFVLCVFVAKLMRRFLPSAATILFGGR